MNDNKRVAQRAENEWHRSIARDDGRQSLLSNLAPNSLEEAMKLVFKGYESAPEKRVSPSECKDGQFKYDVDWAVSGDGQTLTVTFSCVILINRELKGKKLQDVRVHEQRHHQDFKVQADSFRKSLLSAINKGQEPDLETRYKWFEYDVCCKSAAYHRQIGAPVPICIEPSGSRPQ